MMCVSDWRTLFDKAKVTHIEQEASNHCMLLLDTDPILRKGERDSALTGMVVYNEAEDVVKEAWKGKVNGSRMFIVHKKIKVCRIMLLNWNRSLNINAGKEIKWIK
ncbi:hypothetical protein ACH5RR_003399 [Cinchona calisaya]|uniref:Uncharacterized protein n=1 Tax=Cinchona calisaya TaxID=153742 RepID=A0ABD3AUQ2_9GENT